MIVPIICWVCGYHQSSARNTCAGCGAEPLRTRNFGEPLLNEATPEQREAMIAMRSAVAIKGRA